MSQLKKDHVVGAAGAGLLAGAAAGLLGWYVGGALGLTIGAVIGGALGAVWGNRRAEAQDPRDDLGHFEQMYGTMPYYIEGFDWHDYAPAYRYGLESYRAHRGRSFAAMESQLQGGWESNGRFGSRLTWAQARQPVEHAWKSLDAAEHGERPPPGLAS